MAEKIKVVVDRMQNVIKTANELGLHSTGVQDVVSVNDVQLIGTMGIMAHFVGSMTTPDADTDKYTYKMDLSSVTPGTDGIVIDMFLVYFLMRIADILTPQISATNSTGRQVNGTASNDDKARKLFADSQTLMNAKIAAFTPAAAVAPAVAPAAGGGQTKKSASRRARA